MYTRLAAPEMADRKSSEQPAATLTFTAGVAAVPSESGAVMVKVLEPPFVIEPPFATAMALPSIATAAVAVTETPATERPAMSFVKEPPVPKTSVSPFCGVMWEPSRVHGPVEKLPDAPPSQVSVSATTAIGTIAANITARVLVHWTPLSAL